LRAAAALSGRRWTRRRENAINYTVKNFLAAAVLFFPAASASASAADLGPATQTLVALNATPVADSAHFFDGLNARVESPVPTEYLPLPAADRAPADVKPVASAIVPAVRSAVPEVRSEKPAPRPSRRGSDAALWLGVGTAVAVAVVLLLILL
jgi:hypothetical protein